MNVTKPVQLAASVLLLTTSCKGEPSAGVDDRLRSLPTWADFSPLLDDVAPRPVDEAEPRFFTESGEHTVISHEETAEGDAVTTTTEEVLYSCQSVPYTMTDTPEQIVMFNPDVELLWPGALIQGRSHRDGLGSLDALPITKRAPIEVSIPAISSGENFREVASPTQATVASAIGDIVGSAVTADIVTPSTITFAERTYHAESEFALSIGVSARYYGFEGSATGSTERNRAQTTVTAEFTQRMFEVVVAPPETPSSLFSDDFGPEDYDAQAELGRIGDDNLPIYVSNVVYGRMMTFSLTSTASEAEIRATLSASYDALVGGVDANLSARQKTILAESQVAVSSLGGSADATVAMIRSGNWRDYFDEASPLSSAAPLSYTFRNLGDNSIANVSETLEYDVTSCVARTQGDVFEFVDVQEHDSRLPAGYTPYVGDFDGDGTDDLLWNHLRDDTNAFYVGYGGPGGVLDLGEPIDHPAAPTGSWGSYEVHIGDFDGDGLDDVLWNRKGATNEWFVARSTGSDFAFDPVQEHPDDRSWTDVVTVVGDFDGDEADDIVFNDRISTGGVSNLAFPVTGYASGTGFTIQSATTHAGSNGWESYTTHVGDVDDDGIDDLWFSRLDTSNRSHLMLGEPDGSGMLTDGANGVTIWPSTWENYTGAALATMNRDGQADAVFVRIDGGLYVGLANDCAGSCEGDEFTQMPFQGGPALDDDLPDWPAYDWLLADVDGDGRTDVIWHAETTERAAINVALSREDDDGSYFVERPAPQLHPWSVPSWTAYEHVVTGDFDGDG
ncbi:MAG: thiol-activated cytolysin family protein, partial [Myxococcota bacterium]